MEDLVILTRTADLLEWLIPKAHRPRRHGANGRGTRPSSRAEAGPMCACSSKREAFPRPFRAPVTARLLGAALDLPEPLCDAQARRGPARRDRLAQADAALNKLRFYLRLTHQWRWLSAGQYEHASRMVAEIGRLLGGWIRQAANERS